MIGSAAVFVFALLGALAIAFGGDTDGTTMIPGTDTSVPADHRAAADDGCGAPRLPW